MEENSEESILDCLGKNISQKSEIRERDFDSQFQDNAYIEKEILQSCNLDHHNFVKLMEFGINRNTCGPYEFGVQFNAKFFMNILREYYLKLDCSRLNFIFSSGIIYLYGYYNRNLKVYTKLNTHFIDQDLVNILEGYSKEIRANFEVQTLLKYLELHNFANKEKMKMYFSFDKNYRNKSKKIEMKNLNSINPFIDPQGKDDPFYEDFNFEENAIPGNIIIETQTFKCKIESNFAPLELTSPPKIPSAIFTDYILSVSIDKLNSSSLTTDPLSTFDIYCNHYICNFVSNQTLENYLTYDNSEGVQFKYENALKFCKNYSAEVDESNFYLKMMNFTIKKHELNALKIINKKTSVVHFYAGKKEKYYFTKETDQEGRITSAIILCINEAKPLIKDIENCCLFQDQWNEWIDYLQNFLPKDCINELEKMRNIYINNQNDNINASTNNKKKKKRKEEKKSNNKVNNGNNNININNEENADVNNDDKKENEIEGLSVYANDKKGNFKAFNIEVRDIGRENINNENKNENKINNNKKKIVNPFA